MVARSIWDAEAQFESDIFYFAQFSNVGSNPVAPTVQLVLVVSTEDCGSSRKGSNPLLHI